MEKLDNFGKPILTSKKQRIDIAYSPIASINLSESNIKQITSLVHKYNQVSIVCSYEINYMIFIETFWLF